MAVKQDKQEAQRRKLFIKAAHKLYKEYPTIKWVIPEAKTDTERYIDDIMSESLNRLVCCWKESRIGKATKIEFEKSVMDWVACRSYAIRVDRIIIK